MSVFFIVNGGMFNSSIACVFVGEEKDSKTIYERFNEIFSCVKLPIRNKTDICIKHTPVNLYRIPKLSEGDFNSIMNKLLTNYFITAELSRAGVKKFEDNVKNINFGYKEMFGRDMWFISMSFTNIKKIVLEHLKSEGKESKVFKYPSEIKEKVKKPKVSKVSKKYVEIEDDSGNEDIEEEQEIKEKPKKQTVTSKKTIRKTSKSSSLTSEEDEDEDNGIINPIVKPVVKPKEIKKEVKKEVKKVETTVEISDDENDDIEEEIITVNPEESKKKSKEEIDILNEMEDLRENEFSEDERSGLYDTDDELLSDNYISGEEDEEEDDEEEKI